MTSKLVRRPAKFLSLTIVIVLSVSEIQAVPLSLTLDPSQSSITLSGTFSGIDLTEQGPGSQTASYSGQVNVDVDNLFAPTSIQFVGSSATAAVTGQWLPEAGGGPAAGNPGAAQDANYGLQLMGGALGNAFAAVRNLEYDITGGPVPVAAGAFPSTQSLNVASGQFAFNLPAAFATPPGQDDLSGSVLINASATPSTYTVAGETITLTIPIHIIDEDDLTIVYSGQLTATTIIPEPASILLIGLALFGLGGRGFSHCRRIRASWPN